MLATIARATSTWDDGKTSAYKTGASLQMDFRCEVSADRMVLRLGQTRELLSRLVAGDSHRDVRVVAPKTHGPPQARKHRCKDGFIDNWSGSQYSR